MSEYEALAARMRSVLSSHLWDDDLKYLMNFYEGGEKDPHYYIGSLLAAHFNHLDGEMQHNLVETATRHLLDEKVGIYNVFPMDFHQLIGFLKFEGNEAGIPTSMPMAGSGPTATPSTPWPSSPTEGMKKPTDLSSASCPCTAP
ncbi:hypothetical protein HQ585_18225 [candidate division KSB1 bacterium]|nr:hypothetical protein [candidate division KSB1 bacterium]